MDYMLYVIIVVCLLDYVLFYLLTRIHCILHHGSLVQGLQSFRKVVTFLNVYSQIIYKYVKKNLNFKTKATVK